MPPPRVGLMCGALLAAAAQVLLGRRAGFVATPYQRRKPAPTHGAWESVNPQRAVPQHGQSGVLAVP